MARPHGLLYWMKLSTLGNLGQRWKEGRSYLRWRNKEAKRMQQFRQIHQGEDCFIIGNGPSLNQMDLRPLADYHTFGMNKIYLIKKRGIDLNLSYLVSMDELVIAQCYEAFQQQDCPVFVSHTASEGLIPRQNDIYRLYAENTWSFYDDITQPIHNGYTVTFVAMQIAYFMGFRRVFLIGVDHSYKQTKGKQNQTEILEEDDANHFDPDYFKGMKWNLADVYGNEVSYHLANYHYLRDDREIYNATVGGKLDIFPRVSYEQALQMMRKK